MKFDAVNDFHSELVLYMVGSSHLELRYFDTNFVDDLTTVPKCQTALNAPSCIIFLLLF